ncbi:MAG: protein kinase [Catenulispora sp.]|nr:protein kinase [Catenulispora sp.]
MTDVVLDGRYRLLALLGRGGMGEVWRAHDTRIGREVAVKIVTAGGLGDDALARFDREARIAGNVSGPSIVTVHDYGRDEYRGETVPYLVMELVAGRTIGDRIRRDGPPDPRTALEWSLQVCDALAAAHAAGVVHRDIKPGNVMVTDGGALKVLDFGIARFMEHQQTQTGLTAAGMVIGSAEYMSPEQAQGHRVDARSDLYSLGCLLFFTLTGRAPFEAESPIALAYQHVNKAADAPSRYRAGIPAGADALVLELLAKDPEVRPGSAGEVGDRIRRVLAGSGNGSPAGRDTDYWMPNEDTRLTEVRNYPGEAAAPVFPIAPNAGPPPETRSRRWFVAGAAAVAVGGAGVGAWLALGDKSGGSDGGNRSASSRLTGSSSSTSQSSHSSASTSASGAGSSSATSASSPTTSSPTTSSSASGAPSAPHNPAFASSLTGHSKDVVHVAFRADSKLLASCSFDKTARLWDVTDPLRPQPLGTCSKHTDQVWNVAISPDGTTLATSSLDQTVILWDIRDPTAPQPSAQVSIGNKLNGVAFSPNGGTLAVGTWGGTVVLIDVARPTETAGRHTLSGHGSLVYSVAFSPDGSYLASGSFDKTVRLWDVRNPAAAKQIGMSSDHTDRVFDLAYRPDGQLLAAGSADHTLVLLDVADPPHPALVHRLAKPDEPDEATGVAFSPDGRTIANGCGASKQVRVYDVTTPGSPHVFDPLTGHKGYTYGVAYSPDGRLLASGSADGTVRLWRF